MNKNIQGLKIFNHKFHYTTYADDTTFFLKEKISVSKTLNIFEKLFLVFGLIPYTIKFEIATISTMKSVNVAVCGMKCVNLTKETEKILGVHFSYNEKLENETNSPSHIVKIKGILRLRRMID